jgi:DnaJ-class molecular chaperone
MTVAAQAIKVLVGEIERLEKELVKAHDCIHALSAKAGEGVKHTCDTCRYYGKMGNEHPCNKCTFISTDRWEARLSVPPADEKEPIIVLCDECGGIGAVYGGSNPDAPTAEINCPKCHGTGRMNPPAEAGKEG